MPKIASLAHWQCSYWSRSESESKSTLGFRIPSKPNPATRSGLGSFLHPPSRKTPTPFSVKMFAVAAQTTVRATAQVKATKVAAKQQKSAYVHPRFPASFISRRFSFRGAIGGEASARGAETTTTKRARRSRADASRVYASRYRARRPPRRSRASSRVFSERVGRANNSFSGAKTPSRGRDADRKRPRNRIESTLNESRSAVPSPPRLPAPPPRCSCSRPPPWRTA